MNNKTPISLLQELMAHRKECFPTYSDVPSDLPQYPFKCIVKTDKTTAEGYGSTKKEAKHNSAGAALKLLGVTVRTSNNINNNSITFSSASPTSKENNIRTNYVGKLNEFAIIYAKTYPQYQENFAVANSYFTVKCKLQDWEVEGLGSTKKMAKQIAAKKMLDRIEQEQPVFDNFVTISSDKEEKMNRLTQAALKKFEELTINRPVSTLQTTRQLQALRRDVFSLVELRTELEKMDRYTELEDIQENPYIVALKVLNTNCVIMGQGNTRGEALRDLFITSSVMFHYGFTFTSAFSE